MNGQGLGDMSGFGTGEDMLDLGALFGGGDGIDASSSSSLMNQGHGAPASQPSSTTIDLQSIFPDQSSSAMAGPSAGGWMSNAGQPQQQSNNPQQSSYINNAMAGQVGGVNPGMFTNGQQVGTPGGTGFDAASMQYNPQLQQILQQQRLHQQQQQQQQQLQQAQAQNQQRWGGGGGGMSPGAHQGAPQQPQQHVFAQQQQAGLVTPNQMHVSSPAASFDPSQMHLSQQSPSHPQPGNPFGYSAQNLNPFQSPNPMGHMQQSPAMGSPYQHQQMTAQQQQQRQQQLQQQQQRRPPPQSPQQAPQAMGSHIDPSALSNQGQSGFAGMSPQGQNHMYAPSPSAQQQGLRRAPSVSNAMSPGQMTSASGASPPAGPGTPQAGSSTPVLKAKLPRGRPRKKPGTDANSAANAPTPSTVASPGPSRSASFSQSNTQPNGTNQAPTPTPSHAPTPGPESAGPSAAPTPKPAAAALASTGAPPGPRPTGMQPQQLQQMLVTQAYSQFAANMRAQDRARNGQAPPGPHYGSTLIPVNTVPGVGQLSWTPTVAPEVQQRFLELAVQVAKVQAHTSGSQTSPSQVLAAWGMMYIPPQAVPQGVPCSSSKGGAIVTLGDGRLLGVCGQDEQVSFVNLLKQQMQNFKNQSTQRNVQPLQWANLIHQHVMGEQQKTLTQAQTLLSNAINAANTGRGATAPGMQPPNVPQQQIPAQPQSLPQYQQAQGQQVRPPPQQSPVPGQQPNLTHQQASLHQQQQHQAMAAAQAAQAAALQRAQSAQGAAAVHPGTPAHLQQQQQLQMQAQQQLAQAKLGATQPGHSARSPVPPSAIGQAAVTAGHLQSGQGTALTLQQQLAAQAAAQVTAAHPAALPDMKPVNLPPVEGGELPTHTGLGTKIINAMAQVTALPPSLRKPDGTPAWAPLTDRQRAELRQAIVKDDAFVKSREEIHEQTKQKAAKWARELWSEPPKWTVRSIVPSVKGSEERDGVDQKPAPKQQARDVTAKLRGHDTKVESTWAWWEAPEDEDQLPQYSANHPQAREVPGAMEPFRLIMPAEKRERAMKVGSCGRASRLLAPTLCGSRHTVVTTSVRDITASAPTPQAYQLVSTLPEELVPVRLEIDADGWKLRDTFTWNGADEHLPPELFAQVLCDEIALPHHLFVQPIILAIQQQVRDYQLARVLREAGSGAHEEAAIHHTEIQVPAGEEGDDVERTADEALQSSLVANGADAEAPQRGITRLATRAGEPLVGAGKLDAKAAKWWKRWREDVEKKEDELAALDGADGAPSIDELKRKRADEQSAADKRRKIDNVDVMEVDGDGEEVVDDPLVNEVLKDELRILIKLDITVGAMNLVDQFEWDLGDPRNSPEEFAVTFAADLGLSGEFRTAIVHSIREQVAVHLNSLALIGHPFDGTPVADEDLRTAFLPSVAPQADAEGSLFENLMRNDADVDAFTPRLLQLSEDEIQRLDRERERDAKRKKRQTRGRRGVNLPDRDPIKTQRTPVIHGHQTGALDTSESLPTFTAATGLSSRPQRRAAVTAREGFNMDGTSSGTTSAQETAPVSVLAPGGPTIKTRRFRLSNYAVQFAYPGGLGRAEDPGGPKFTSGEAKENPPTPVRPKTETRGPRRPSPPRDPAVEKALTRQHPNVFDGLWHCGNCGIPATLTTSRRKGPAGDKTMCAPCGKHWNRYRKALPVEYTRDEDYHAAQLAAKNKSHKAQVSVGARGIHAGGDEEEWGNASTADTPHQREESQAVATQAVDAAESKLAAIAPSVASSTRGQSPDLPFLQVGSPDDSNNSSDSRSPSPAPDARNASQARGPSPPKRSGAGLVEPRGNGLSIAAPALVRSVSASSAQNADGSPAPSAHALGASPPPPPAGVSATPAPTPPAWLEREMRSLSARYPNDRFDTLLKASRAGAPPAPAPEWRIRCADCPGKVYVPGPNETLENFMLHLRNRKHRAAVADRVAGRAGAAAASADTPATPAPAPAAAGPSEQSNTNTNDADTSMAPP